MEEREKNSAACPPVLALFQKRIEGDDTLLELASLRFGEAGLGAEYYAETPEELEGLLQFRPFPGAPASVHLHREIDLFQESGRSLVMDFSKVFRGRIFGMIAHDQAGVSSRLEEYIAVLGDMDRQLREVEGSPLLFIEYASGLEPELFLNLFARARAFERVSACIDIGHIGIRLARAFYAQRHPGEDVCALRPDTPGLEEVIADVESAVRSARDSVLRIVSELSHTGKPLHFHLHDAHPLSTASLFGVSDHLSFLDRIPLPFAYGGRNSLDPMFGPSGLSEIVTEALRLLGRDRISFCLEIHPREGRLPLGNAAHLFRRWKDKGNAERMNFWLSVLCENHELLQQVCMKGEKR
ncbi:MAG: hypothetical protein M1497_14730 [Nitrospirae bacterium]|nr:hypothetical protein [Nitrospirota bacterium]